MKEREQKMLIEELSQEEINLVVNFREQKAKEEKRKADKAEGLELIEAGLELFIKNGGKVYVPSCIYESYVEGDIYIEDGDIYIDFD